MDRHCNWTKLLLAALMSFLSFGCLPCSKARVQANDSQCENEASPPAKQSYEKLTGECEAREESTLIEEQPLLTRTDSAMVEFKSNYEDYDTKAVIGKGYDDATTVYLAKHLPSGSLITVRKTNLDACEDISLVQNEIAVCRLLKNTNLLPYYCSAVNKNYIWSVAPVMSYGSARDLLHAHFTEGLNELAIAFILRDVLCALEYIHSLGYVHRSVKASHILVSQSGRACLSGLRTSCSMIRHGVRLKKIHDFPRSQIETNMYWLAPEILGQSLEGYGVRSDVYSLGITACELANGCVPFQDMIPSLMLLEKLNGTMPRLLDSTTIDITSYQLNEDGDVKGVQDGSLPSNVGQDTEMETIRLPYHRTFSHTFHQFVEVCLHRNPSLRPTAAQLLNHPFIRQIKKLSIDVPSLLAPVKPMNDISVLPKGDPAELENAVANLSLNDRVSWVFD